MRFSHFSVFALSGLSIASPVVTKRADTLSLLTDLYATVQVYTGAISKPSWHFLKLTLTILDATLAPLSASSSLLDKTAATAQIGTQLNLITAAVTSTTNEIKTLPPATTPFTKRAQPVEKRQDVLIGVAAILSLIIIEILATVGAAIAILGGAVLLVFTTPLTTSLAGLIIAVELILDVTLVGVIALLDTLLTGLALGVSGL
jgi:hypothetical protein